MNTFTRAVLLAAAAALLPLTPATAGLLDSASLLKVAQVVLRSKALLDRGQARCGEPAALQPKESMLVTAANLAVQQALPKPKFNALDLLANRQATTAAAAPGFCTTATQQKPALLGQVASAAQQLGVGGNLGLAGALVGSGALGGTGTTGTTTTGNTTVDTIGSLLGK